MLPLKTSLKKRLKSAKRIALLGIGSQFRGDDAAGILIARSVDLRSKKLKKEKRLKVFVADTAPENLTGEVKYFNPEHLVIVDAADMHEKPGTVKLINPDTISGFSSCTHTLPIKIFTDYMVSSIGCCVTIIGIQPKTLEFDSHFSLEVKRSVQNVSQALISSF